MTLAHRRIDAREASPATPGAPARGCRGRAGTAPSPASRDWSERTRVRNRAPDRARRRRPSTCATRAPPSRRRVGGRGRAPGDAGCGASRRTRCPTPSPFGQSWRAMVSETIATPASAVRSAGVKSRPLTTANAEHLEVFGRYAQLVDRHRARRHRTLRSLHASSATPQPRAPPADGPSAAWSSAARRGELSKEILNVSLVRTPGSFVAAAKAPRRNTAAQIRRRADAPTWTAIRACRARRGRASLVTSPRMVRTRSRRVACSAGASPKITVDTMAPATMNTSIRQSRVTTAGLKRFTNCAISGGSVVTTA